jgi:DNA repair exonuclease SbcCD ATPase subunit
MPESKRQKIIELYLSGVSPQSKIAQIAGVSDGAASNVIRRQRDKLGQRDFDAIRELAVSMKQAGVTAEQCATGFRIHQMLSNMNLLNGQSDELTAVESFVNDVYLACNAAGLPEDKLVEYSKQLFELSSNESIEPAQAPEHYKKTVDDLHQAEAQLKVIEEQKSKALEDNEATVADLQQFRYVKGELAKYGRQIDDIPKLVNMLNNAEKLGHNASRIAAKLSMLESIEQEIESRAGVCNALDKDAEMQSEQLSLLKEQVETYQDVVNELNELKRMGCGVSDLRILQDTITGIVNASAIRNKKITPQKAFKIFVQQVEQHYDKVVGFEHLVQEVDRLTKQHAKLEVDMPLLEQQKKEAQDYINKKLPDFNKTLDGFTAHLGIAQGEIDAISKKIEKAGKESTFDLEIFITAEESWHV